MMVKPPVGDLFVVYYVPGFLDERSARRLEKQVYQGPCPNLPVDLWSGGVPAEKTPSPRGKEKP